MALKELAASETKPARLKMSYEAFLEWADADAHAERVESQILPGFWLRPAWLWQAGALDPLMVFFERRGLSAKQAQPQQIQFFTVADARFAYASAGGIGMPPYTNLDLLNLSSRCYAPAQMNRQIDTPPPVRDQPPPRQRWDERYATFSPKDRGEPTPFVVACLPHLPRQGRALDVAAGAGRHSLALAQHGLQVDAVDISCQGLRLAQQRAREAGVSIRFIVADIERPWLPRQQYEVILVAFFLYRPLFPLLKERLRPGGWLIYETLTTAQQAGMDGPPMRRDFLLEPGELRAALADFEILFYAEADHGGRATAQLLARKPNTPGSKIAGCSV